MARTIIKTPKAPLPIGPYNQAVSYGGLVFVSGQIALDAKTGTALKAGVPEQTRIALTQLKAILEEAGSSLPQVLKTTVFLKNMSDFPVMNAVYQEFFDSATAPARSTIEVARLPKDVLVEVEAVAATEKK